MSGSNRQQQLIVFPHWVDNPYVNLLYLAARADGYDVKKTTIMSSLVAALGGATVGDIVHVHWTAPICQRAHTDEESWAELERFTTATDAALERGAELVWTVHNRMPHECPFPEQELALIAYLIEKTGAIHVMTNGTAAAVAADYLLPPEKVVVIPHSSYKGIYDQSISRAEARAHWDIGDDEKVILFFGQMRAYKGLDVLLAAVRDASKRTPNLTLMMAGKTAEADLEGIEALLPSSVRTIRDHRYIPDSETQMWFAGADLAVFPYMNVLNSGSAHLSATFGVPTVLPRERHFVTHFGAEPWVRFYDPRAAVDSLAAVIADFEDHDRLYSAAAHAFTNSFTPYDMSRAYLALVKDLGAGAGIVTR